MLDEGMVYAVYGLAFFSMGLAVTVRCLAFPSSRVRNRFLALGLFGLIHGVFEWQIWWNLVYPVQIPFLAKHGLAALSFLAIGYFGLTGIFKRDGPVWNIILIAGGLWTLLATLALNPLTVEIATRWGLAVPASSLAGYVILKRLGVETPSRRSEIAALAAAVVFFTYAFLQIFLNSSNLPTTSVFSTANFEALTGVSVLLARTGAAIAMMVAALTLLGVIDTTIREEASRQYRETLARLELSENLLKSVFAMAPAGIALARSSNGEIIQANTALLNSLGLEHDAFERLSQLNDLGFNIGKRIDSLLKCGAAAEPLEVELRRKDGRLVCLRLEATALDDDGEAMSLIIAQDITELRDQSRLLEQERSDAQSANIAKSQFLANMSHEIRTPMNAVLGTISVLQRTELNDKQQKMVDIAQRGGETLLSLLNDILDLSRIEAGELKLSSQPVNMVEIAELTLDLHRARAAEKNLPLELYAPDTATPDVLGDPVRIRQILSNLVSNAIKFTEDGAVTLEIRSERLNDEMHAVICSVRDTGIGMDPEQLDSIFDRFSQVDTPSARTSAGSGLGLSIVRGLAEAMDSSVDVTSAPGEGSEFTVSFKLARAEGRSTLETAPRPPVADSPSPSKRRPLMVDDDELNIATFRTMLDGQVWEPTLLRNGVEALEMIKSETFDAIFLDLHMPDFDGVDTLKAMQAHWGDQGHPCPVIACTADAFAEAEERCLQAGFDQVLTKPVTIEKINAIFEALPANTAKS